VRHRIEEILGGDWRGPGLRDARCLVVDRGTQASEALGRVCVGDVARVFERGAEGAAVLTGAPARPPFLFLDLETTGLSGGAGTCAFLVGCGWFDGHGGFATRQYVLARPADEPVMLEMVAGDLAEAGVLVSFNGKSFDVPVLETRYLFHRLEWIGRQLPHLDVLHPARRFWRSDGAEAPGAMACSLASLEREVLGAHRTGDVAGYEIPSRYFQFVRTSDARPLVDVLEHNRRDLLALAGLAARLLHLVADGANEAQDAREAFAVGRVYERAGRDRDAADAFERALALVASPAPAASAGTSGRIAAGALRSLAVLARRGRRYDAAALRWRELVDRPGCPPRLAREGLEALAIHHEHRVRDLQAAKTFALQGLERAAPPGTDGTNAAGDSSLRHRLARLNRKMARAAGAAPTLQLEW
jgi:uncharacterized protein YprB with RNaseH-like and TPR domain